MSGRWFKVTAKRFDCQVSRSIRSFKHGDICFATKKCVDYGLSINAIEIIDRPEGFKTNKSGMVVKKCQ